MSILSINNLWKKSDTTFALKDVSLFVLEKEWFLFTGPVNEGKEVLQQILLGLDEEWDGTIYFQGKSIKEIRDYRLKVALIHHHFIESEISSSVFDYLALPLKLNGRNEQQIKKQIEEEMVNFTPGIDIQEKVYDLSFREKVVIQLLRATLINPKLIIIEEPFLQMPTSKRKIIKTVFNDFKKYWKKCSVIIFSSYVYEWFELCERIAVLHNQSVIQVGHQSELLQCPNNIFVAKYIDSEAYTFLQGKIKLGVFQGAGFSFTIPSYMLTNINYYDGQTVYIGFRDIFFELVEESNSQKEGLKITIPISFKKEVNGNYKIYSNVGGQPLVAQCKKDDKINEDNEAVLYYPYNRLRFFDSNLGTKI